MEFESVEKAIVAELKKARGLATVESYAGQLEAEIESLPVRFPAAFVLYSGSVFRPIDGQYFEEEAAFTVLVAARGLRGRGQAGAGAYEAIKAVMGALANSTLGLQMQRLAPARASLMSATGGVAIYALEFRAVYDRDFSIG